MMETRPQKILTADRDNTDNLVALRATVTNGLMGVHLQQCGDALSLNDRKSFLSVESVWNRAYGSDLDI